MAWHISCIFISMKIAVTATGPSLDSEMDSRFGRCAYFLFVETKDMSFEVVANPSTSLGGGAGVQSGQLISKKGAEYLLTGNCGPNAFATLKAAGIEVVTGCSGTVRQAAERFLSGAWKPIEQPNVGSHFGMGTGGGPASAASG
jgi:predicted Fe-Mo cluster-binding NifX family protein